MNEASPPLTPIGTVHATDKDQDDSSTLQYFIAHAHSGHFWVDRLTGEVFVSRWLDREGMREEVFTVMAVDSGRPDALQGRYCIFHICYIFV